MLDKLLLISSLVFLFPAIQAKSLGVLDRPVKVNGILTGYNKNFVTLKIQSNIIKLPRKAVPYADTFFVGKSRVSANTTINQIKKLNKSYFK